MSRSRFAIAAYVLLVFLSGILVGAFGYRLYTASAVNATAQPRSPEEYRQKYLAEMKSRLGLDAGQVTRLNSILDETRKRYRELREQHEPAFKAIREDQVSQINAILNAGQRSEYTKMRQERDRHVKRK